MTLTQITFFFLLIISVIGISMVVHSWIDKRRIKKNFLRLATELKGYVVQENRLIYPYFTGDIDGRRFDLFFKVVKVGRQHILYYIYSLKSDVPCDLLLLKSEYFKPIKDEAAFSGNAGQIVQEIAPNYQLRSLQPEAAREIFEKAGIKEFLSPLDEFSSLQLGPDALVVGKPYDGPGDTDPSHIVRNVGTLKNLAEAMERCFAPA
ncbi:MAG: hypothetical protein EPO39_13225 [Candidatus Manganitrophaceae bacterium]|nr:MAG: hypothetical protein EPO39_13225 [Candidatus Manganitrophaceae bacterium]